MTGQKIVPVDCAGLYVPGGTAAYPSTVLMDALPAKIAGVKNLVMVTPPRPDGASIRSFLRRHISQALTKYSRLAAHRR